MAEANEDAVLLDGFDSAIIGTTIDGCVVYSYERMLDVGVAAGTDPADAADVLSYATLAVLDYIKKNVRPVVVSLFDAR